ncbi:MAG: hypothetical protein ACJA16_003347 [Akkermansiaceae bacterium]
MVALQVLFQKEKLTILGLRSSGGIKFRVIDLIVVVGADTVLRGLAILAHHDDSRR